jgi:hypothetical protein
VLPSTALSAVCKLPPTLASLHCEALHAPPQDRARFDTVVGHDVTAYKPAGHTQPEMLVLPRKDVWVE